MRQKKNTKAYKVKGDYLLSIIWFLLIFISVAYGLCTKNIENVIQNISLGATESVNLLISLIGIMCFWSGIMEILKESGLINVVSKITKPILSKLFKKSSKDKKAMTYIASNFTANLLGLSNAATPMGLKAAERIYELNGKKGTPKELIMLVIINCSSIQLIPTTVAGLRTIYGSQNAFDILPSVWITSLVSVSGGILCAKIFEKMERR